MTDYEKAIFMAYTGVCTLTGDKLETFYKYINKLMGRPVYTHELADSDLVDEVKRLSQKDFIAVCKDENVGEWVNMNDPVMPYGYNDDMHDPRQIRWARCSWCGITVYNSGVLHGYPYCPYCGNKKKRG